MLTPALESQPTAGAEVGLAGTHRSIGALSGHGCHSPGCFDVTVGSFCCGLLFDFPWHFPEAGHATVTAEIGNGPPWEVADIRAGCLLLWTDVGIECVFTILVLESEPVDPGLPGLQPLRHDGEPCFFA